MNILYSFLKYILRKHLHYKYPVFLFFILSVPAFSDDNPMSLSSKELDQGEAALIKIIKTGADEPKVKWMDKKVSLLYRPDKKIYEGFIAVDLGQKPGSYDLSLISNSSGKTTRVMIKIHAKDYGVRNLTLPAGQVDLSPENQARVNKEKAIIDWLWKKAETPVIFKSPFIMPLESEVIGPFGRRSVINGKSRSPHTGVDMRGKRGVPVKAANDGRVVFTGDHFFTGNSVIIDHGAGIFSMYFHLDKINVNNNTIISRGEVLGTVGSTGRSTGPHLHWGVRVNNMRVDPINFVKVSSHMEE